MEISDYIFFSLIGLTVIVTFGVSCYGLYCWWKSKRNEPRSCYVAIAHDNSPLSSCADPCVFGCEVCKNTSSIGSSPPVFSPTYRTPGSKYSSKVLVTSGGFPITTPLLRTGSSSRSRYGSTNTAAKRSSKSSLKKFTLIRDYIPDTYDNEAHGSKSSQSTAGGATASPSNRAKSIITGIHSNYSQITQADLHLSSHSDSSSTMVPVVMDLDLIKCHEQSNTLPYLSTATDSYSSKNTTPGTLEVSECVSKEIFTPGRYSTPSYTSHALRTLSSSSDYARSSSDNSWESSSGSITCAIESSSSPLNKKNVNLPPICKESIKYIEKDGKGVFTSDTSLFANDGTVFSYVPL